MLCISSKPVCGSPRNFTCYIFIFILFDYHFYFIFYFIFWDLLFQLLGDCAVCHSVAKCLDFLVVFAYFYFDAIVGRGTAAVVSGRELVKAVSWLRVWLTDRGKRSRCSEVLLREGTL